MRAVSIRMRAPRRRALGERLGRCESASGQMVSRMTPWNTAPGCRGAGRGDLNRRPGQHSPLLRNDVAVRVHDRHRLECLVDLVSGPSDNAGDRDSRDSCSHWKPPGYPLIGATVPREREAVCA